MKQQAPSLARAAALLLAAAALPATALTAQETQPPADPPVVETTTPPPAAETSIPPAPAPVTTAPPEVEATTPAPVIEAEAAPPTRPARTTTTRRTTTRTTARAPVAVVAPAPVAVAPAPVEALPVETLPPPVAQTPPPEVLPETTTAPVETVQESNGSMLPWLLAGLLLVGALAFFALRRRRRTEVYDEVYEPAPVVAPVAAATPVVAETPAGRPELELEMRPVRAGVSGDDARVEFELTVGNRGPVAAEDVRISTWMLASGATEAERALIEPHDHADTAPVRIAAGEERTVEASVALPTSEVEGDAVLPVVVADARYRLPDGSEGRTSASFAVGVPDGEELAHFAVDNPSGLHEDVVARPLGEPERV
jgi:hypothetical protein